MTIKPIRDGHYRRYRRAGHPPSAVTRTASAKPASQTLACPEPGTFTIVEEVYWLLVLAAQLGWPFPGLLLSKLRPSLDHRFDMDTARYLIRKEPKVHVLQLASAGVRVRHLDPKLANELIASTQASGSQTSKHPKFGVWPEPSPAAEAVWDNERRALLEADDERALSSSADRCYWLAMALAQAGWPMPASVTRRFSAYWVTYAFSGDRLAALLGPRSEFGVADAILAGVRVEGLSGTAMLTAVARRLGLEAPNAEVDEEHGYERLLRSFSTKQIGQGNRVLLRNLADRMRGVLTGRDQNAGQRLTLDMFLYWRDYGALLEFAPAAPTSNADGLSQQAPETTITDRAVVHSSPEEPPVEARKGAQANEPQGPINEEPTRLATALEVPEQPAWRRVRSPDEIERERRRAQDEQAARHSGLIAADEATPDHDEIKRRLQQREKEEREKQSALWAKLHAKQRPSSVLYDAASVDESEGHDDSEEADEADGHEESTSQIASSVASGSDQGSDAVAQEQATLDIVQPKSPASTTAGGLSEPPIAPPQADAVKSGASETATQEHVALESPEKRQDGVRLPDIAVIQHRLRLPSAPELAEELLVGVMHIELSALQIIEALPYPRESSLNDALVAFGHQPLRSAADCHGPVAAVLGQQADIEREDLRRMVHGKYPKAIPQYLEIPERWQRAVAHMKLSRISAGYEPTGADRPNQWDPLLTPHPTTYSDEGYLRVCELNAIYQTYLAMRGSRDRSPIFEELAGRSRVFKEVVSVAQASPDREVFLQRAMSDWKSACEQYRIDDLLPGFCD